MRQLADTVSAAVQVGSFPDGLARLEGICQRLRDEKADPELLAYVTLRTMNASYSQSLQDPNADLAKVQAKWIADLEQFVTEFAATKDAAEAMLSLAMAEEFGGDDDKAVARYSRIAQEFPDTPAAQKAAGAKRRIESVGKPAEFRGQDTAGKPFDLAALRGSVVIVHYWATWASPSIKDISVLKDMQAKYGKDKVALVGINIDSTREELDQYLSDNPLPWPQLFEPGGLDSPLANAWGILTLPAMLLIDKEGKVVSRNLQAGEIDTQLRGLLR
jgi:thiol-disulfide isomerase/thioredoxin